MGTPGVSTQAWLRTKILDGQYMPPGNLSSLFVYSLNALRDLHLYGFFRLMRKKLYRGIFAQLNYGKHRRLSMALCAARKNGVLPNDQDTIYKPMYRCFARFMNAAARYNALIFHYSFIHEKFKNIDAPHEIASGITIWSKNAEGGNIRVCLEYAERTRREGELALVFFYNAIKLHTMTFSFFPGDILGFGAGAALFIGGNQGEKNCGTTTRIATKLNDEISPAAMLLIAAQAMGIAIKADSIVGVSAKSLVRGGIVGNIQQYRSSYDELWTVSGGRCFNGKAFILPFDETELPILSKNRSRTRRKRTIKNGIRSEIIHYLEGVLRGFKTVHGLETGQSPPANYFYDTSFSTGEPLPGRHAGIADVRDAVTVT